MALVSTWRDRFLFHLTFTLSDNQTMKRNFAATVWAEGALFVSQCLEIDIASQGVTEDEALTNLKEALELYFEEPTATRLPAR